MTGCGGHIEGVVHEKKQGRQREWVRVNYKFWFGCVVCKVLRCWKNIETVGDIGWNSGAKSHSSYRFVSLPNQQMQDPGTK